MAAHPGSPGRIRRLGSVPALFRSIFLGLVVLGLTALATASPAAAAAPSASTSAAKPTVVLVHGAFADASSWSGVVTRLQKRGYRVVVPAVGLRSLTADSAYLHSLLAQIPGPVVLVGHSYGGAVISSAATGAKNVRALVFVNAFAPERGEVLGQVEKGSTDSALNSALIPLTYPTGNGTTAQELIVDPAKFRAVFAADLSVGQAAELAATQRPAAAAAFSEPAGPPAWKTLPSWAVVSTGDKAAGTDITLAQAKRAGAAITELPGSHLIMISRPGVVTDVIVEAANGVRT